MQKPLSQDSNENSTPGWCSTASPAYHFLASATSSWKWANGQPVSAIDRSVRPQDEGGDVTPCPIPGGHLCGEDFGHVARNPLRVTKAAQVREKCTQLNVDITWLCSSDKLVLSCVAWSNIDRCGSESLRHRGWEFLFPEWLCSPIEWLLLSPTRLQGVHP